MNSFSRRQLLKFFGAGTSLAGLAITLDPLLIGCTSSPKVLNVAKGGRSEDLWKPLRATKEDALVLADGLDWTLLISWQDQINRKEFFGYNNDFIAIHTLTSERMIMWVNHEYLDGLAFVPHRNWTSDRTVEQIRKERKELGGSLIELKKVGAAWQFVAHSSYNRRIDALTPIPFSGGHKIFNARKAIGTFSNCAGGQTTWGTFLTCEENYHDYVGEVDWSAGLRRHIPPEKWHWHLQSMPPEHYGWVVEINPQTGQAVKHPSMGRFAHEGATLTTSKDGRAVVYMGDDKSDECLYKFISKNPQDLSVGTLYVASLEAKKWLPLTLENPRLKEKFKDLTELLVRTREAAHLVGGSPLHRPEDIAIHPTSNEVFIACTNNKKKNDIHGSILKICENNSDPLSLDFEFEYFKAGGRETGFSCPDNLVFDSKGNLWFTTDVSESAIHDKDHSFLGNNSLFVIPFTGHNAGKALRIASAPVYAELTGPCFSPDGETLFLSVQHPGGGEIIDSVPASQWPEKGKWPRPSVVAITGAKIKNLDF